MDPEFFNEPYWITKEGIKIPLRSMTDLHLRNTVLMLRRGAKIKRTQDGQPYFKIQRMKDYDDLIKEVTRRDMQLSPTEGWPQSKKDLMIKTQKAIEKKNNEWKKSNEEYKAKVKKKKAQEGVAAKKKSAKQYEAELKSIEEKVKNSVLYDPLKEVGFSYDEFKALSQKEKDKLWSDIENLTFEQPDLAEQVIKAFFWANEKLKQELESSKSGIDAMVAIAEKKNKFKVASFSPPYNKSSPSVGLDIFESVTVEKTADEEPVLIKKGRKLIL